MEHNSQILQYHVAMALMHLNSIAGLIPFLEPPEEWQPMMTDPANGSYRIAQIHPNATSTHHTSGRHLHTFVPLPSSTTTYRTLLSHGGLPSHMVVNPEPHLRPTPIPSEDTSSPMNPIRSRPNNRAPSAPRTVVTSSTVDRNPATINPAPHPESRPKKKQRIHVALTDTHTETITAPSLRAGCHTKAFTFSSDESDSETHKRPVSSNPAPGTSSTPAPTDGPSVEHPAVPEPNPKSLPLYSPVAGPLPPDRPWQPGDDNELVSYKTDTKSRPSWKTISMRLRPSIEACKARWLWLKNTQLDDNSRPEPEGED